MTLQPQPTLETAAAEGHGQTGSPYSNAKYPFEFSRQPFSPSSTQQTNGNKWLNQKACSVLLIVSSFNG